MALEEALSRACGFRCGNIFALFLKKCWPLGIHQIICFTFGYHSSKTSLAVSPPKKVGELLKIVIIWRMVPFDTLPPYLNVHFLPMYKILFNLRKMIFQRPLVNPHSIKVQITLTVIRVELRVPPLKNSCGGEIIFFCIWDKSKHVNNTSDNHDSTISMIFVELL